MKVQAHKNGIFSFLTEPRVTYHGKIVRRAGPKRLKNYKGVAVYKNQNGTYSPGFDKDSEFDTPGDLHAFIRSWKTNPAKFDKCVREVKASLKRDRRKGSAYAICTKAGTRNPSDYSGQSEHTKAIRKLATRLGVSFGTAAAYYEANGGSIAKAVARYRDDQKWKRNPPTRKNIIPLSAWDVIAVPDLTQLMDKGGAELKKAVSGGATHRKRKNPTRRNTVDAAAREFEATHGYPATKRTDYVEKIHEHSVLPDWGKLERLDIEPIAGGATVKVEGFKGARLAFNEQRKKRPQLFIVGGDQSVDLKAFGIQPPYHESEVLGLVKQVWYFTTKDHLAPEDGGTATYRHAFRFGKRKPMLIYDTVNKLLSFSGGKYTILDEGIDN